MDDAVKRLLVDMVGEENVSDTKVWPTDVDQISQIMMLANEKGFPVTPRSSGTPSAETADTAQSGLILDVCRMNEILDIRVPDRLAIVQPGVAYEDLNNALAPKGFFVPPDSSNKQGCTIGGNVATNAGGIRGAKYGMTKDYVLALTVVLPDGRILGTGSTCMKSVSGYDLTRFFVGSEGTLGIIADITLKINPKPLVFKTALCSFASLADAGKAITGIMQSGIIPSVLEVLDENTMHVLRKHDGIDLPDGKALLFTETDGYTESEVTYQMERVVKAFKACDGVDIDVAETKEASEKLWHIRRSISACAESLMPDNISEDVTVPISQIPNMLTGTAEICRRYDLSVVVFGHAGDGNLHPKIMYDASDPDQIERLENAFSEILKLAIELGGTLAGEHGLGSVKAPYMKLEHDAVAMDVMRTLKSLFDPNNILKRFG